MHPLRHPRNSVAVGLMFVFVAIIYWAAPKVLGGHIDYAGITMLALLGIGMGLMAYILVAGSPRD